MVILTKWRDYRRKAILRTSTDDKMDYIFLGGIILLLRFLWPYSSRYPEATSIVRNYPTGPAGVTFFISEVEARLDDEKCLMKTEEDDVEAKRLDDRSKVWDSRLATFTIVLNVILIFAKIMAAYLSNSLAVLASVVDSAMDITSGVVIWWTCRAVEKVNRQLYPAGLDRLEPLTVLVVGMIMIFANVVVIERAVDGIITGDLHPKVDIAILVILCTGTAIKLALYIICRSRKSAASKCLAIDQRNDCLTNMVALAGAYLGSQFWKYLDPIGALCVSGFIVITWLLTLLEQVPLLIGKTAEPEYINRITQIAVNNDPRIIVIDLIHMYHFGANFIVELHVVMSRDVCLEESHDVSEGLQCKLEKLQFVQRAFVHSDYELDGDEHL